MDPCSYGYNHIFITLFFLLVAEVKFNQLASKYRKLLKLNSINWLISTENHSSLLEFKLLRVFIFIFFLIHKTILQATFLWFLINIMYSMICLSYLGFLSFWWKEKWCDWIWRICPCTQCLPSLCSYRRQNRL